MHPISSRFLPVLTLFGAFVLVGGCTPSPAPKPAGTASPAKPAQAESSAEITIEPIKLADFEKKVEQQRGKVVVVDIWADYCIPCKQEFPNLVRLHEKYAKDGLVCMSVSLDDTDGKDACLRFLSKEKAAFANYLRDEDEAVWQNKWDFTGPPVVLVFDRAGKMRRFRNQGASEQYEYKADVIPYVEKLLGVKP